MSSTAEPLPTFLTGAPTIGDAAHVTAKWTAKATSRAGRAEAVDAIAEVWSRLAETTKGSVSVEINRGVGEPAVLVHLGGEAEAITDLFAATPPIIDELRAIAAPELHVVRAVEVPAGLVAAIEASGVPVGVGTWAFGHERDDTPVDPSQSIEVTAIWAGGDDTLAELEYWWQRVATEAKEIEPGLVRFEAYRVPGEQALVIHETFSDTKTLKFHLTKGTAAMFKKELDAIAAPRNYYFRGPVSWLIRTYSKFMRLPATYSTH